MIRTVCLLLAVLCVASPGLAATLYVTDQLEITLRAGPGTGFKILKMAQTGQAFETLEESEGWTRVRGQDGSEGWVVSRYLSAEPPKGPRLEAALRQSEALEAEAARLREETREAREQARRSSAEAGQLRSRLQTVEGEFAAWKAANEDVIAITERAKSLAAERESTQAELERLRSENRALLARDKFYWFFSGVVVLLLGWALGYVYATSRKRARAQSRFR